MGVLVKVEQNSKTGAKSKETTWILLIKRMTFLQVLFYRYHLDVTSKDCPLVSLDFSRRIVQRMVNLAPGTIPPE